MTAPEALSLPHQVSVSDGGDLVQLLGPLGLVIHHRADVQDAVESSGGSPNLERSEGRHLGLQVKKIAEDQSDGADEVVADVTDGVDLDRDSGGLPGEEFGRDLEEEPVVPSRVLTSDFVDLCPNLAVRVDPGDCVRLHPP